MFSVKSNSKFFQNVCTMSLRRLGTLNELKHQNRPIVVHTDKLFAEEDINRFNSRLPELMKPITEDHDFKVPLKRLATNTCRLLPHKMMIEGLKSMELYKHITDSRSEEKDKNAEILGWCANILMQSFFINDDIMEGNNVRWEKPSYHTWEGVGRYAVNDSAWMDQLCYLLLKKYFGTKPWYMDYVDALHDVSYNTAIGQGYENCLWHNGKLQFQDLTLENYKIYAIHKGRFPMIQLHLVTSHFAAENYDVDFPKKAKNALDELGIYLIIQNDLTDYVSDDYITKSHRSDIARGAFTWLLLQTLIRGSSAQKDIVKKHYAINDSDSVLKVIGVYEDLQLFDLYEQYVKKSREYVLSETEKAPINQAQKNSIFKLTELLYET